MKNVVRGWRDDVDDLFAQRGDVVDFSSVENLSLYAEMRHLSVVEFLVEAIRHADLHEQDASQRSARANRAGAAGALLLAGVPSNADARALTGSNGEVPNWPSLTARQAWAYASYRRSISGDERSGGSAGSGRKHWDEYSAALKRALEYLLESDIDESTRDTSWREGTINQTVTRFDADKGTYILRTDFRMRRTGRVVRIAQTYDEPSSDWICAEFPEILDIFTTTVGGFMRFGASVRQTSDYAPWHQLEFQIDEETIERVSRKFEEASSFGLVVWQSNDIGFDGEYWLSLTCDFELPLRDQYFYWSPPHRVELLRIRADLSALGEIVRGKLMVLPKLGRRPSVRIDQAMGVIDVEVNDWMSPGHSIDMRWDGP